ncbi:unnamed protein product [Calypogeia fissa]
MEDTKVAAAGDDVVTNGAVVPAPAPAVIKETRSEVLARHQKEIKELQNKEIGLKKAAAKGSKAEQKAKKKLAEEEIARLDLKLKARHVKELAALGVPVDEKAAGSVDNIAKAIAGVTTDGGSQQTRPSKGQKWREKRAQQEAEREQRIQEEQNNVVSQRAVEEVHLKEKLRPLGFTLKEVKSDGHCMYRAVEDQLALYPEHQQYTYKELRNLAADYMRSHADDYIPFIAGETVENENPGEPLGLKFERYCGEVQSTAAWGGQLELGALSHALRKHIVVYAANLPDVEMGSEYVGDIQEDESARSPSIRVSYHRHAFGLGEHYNSVVPAQPLLVADPA